MCAGKAGATNSPPRDGAAPPRGVAGPAARWPGRAGAGISPGDIRQRGHGVTREARHGVIRGVDGLDSGLFLSSAQEAYRRHGMTGYLRKRARQRVRGHGRCRQATKAGAPRKAGGRRRRRAPRALRASVERMVWHACRGRSGAREAYRQKRRHGMTGCLRKRRRRG